MKRSDSLKQLQTWNSTNLCVQCKGECCKTAPGESSPADFSAEGRVQWGLIRELLESGNWCVDWWEGDPDDDSVLCGRSYFLRPNAKGDGEAFAPDVLRFKSECKFLTDHGCEADVKPFGCRTLKPDPEGCYHSDLPDGVRNSRQVSSLLWKPYSQQLFNLAEEIMGWSP